jgi:hypothetical protein
LSGAQDAAAAEEEATDVPEVAQALIVTARAIAGVQ